MNVSLAVTAARFPDRRFEIRYEHELPLIADRERARFSAWYELFPRSTAAEPGVHGTFKDVEGRLPAIAAMGFDIVYLPPIQPVGRINRKGPNNTLTPGPFDPGSPWAIGADEGGHDTVHPDLGTLEDFDAFVARARELGVDADIVVPVPDSGVPAALGYAQESGIPYEMGIIRSHYLGRTFIQPSQGARQKGVRMKHSPNKSALAGKRVVLIDDSIVRGTTSQKIIRMLRDAGAKEVHMRISSPATISPCYYGIDTPTRSELIASSNSVEEIRQYIEADTLGYLSNDGMYTHFDGKKEGFCDACFTGNYPVHFEDEGHTRQLQIFDAMSR